MGKPVTSPEAAGFFALTFVINVASSAWHDAAPFSMEARMLPNSALASAGVFKPHEIALLRKVFDAMALDGDTEIDRETRAGALVRLYQSGMTSEDDLLKALGYDEIVGRTAAQLRRSGT